MNLFCSLLMSICLMQYVLPGFPVARYLMAEEVEWRIPKARKVIQADQKMVGDSVIVSSRQRQEFLFNKNGKLVMMYHFDPSGKRYLIYAFDNAGRIVYHRKEEEGEIFTYSYNDKARTSKEFYYDKDSVLIETTVAYYNAKRQLMRKEIYRSDAKLSRYWTYDYTTHGDRVRERFTNTTDGVRLGSGANATLLPGDSTLYRYTYGDTATIGRLGADGKIKELTKEFKVKDTLVTQRYLESTKLKKLIMVSENKVIGQTRIERRKVYTWHAYTIENGVLQRYLNYDDTRIIQQDEYRYIQKTDIHGNWTSRITEMNGKKIHRSERTIDYY